MDRWRYYHITHARHSIMNPLSSDQLDLLVELAAPGRSAAALDIACGKAELLRRLARRHRCTGVGVDLSPFSVRDARRRIARARLGRSLEIVEGDGSKFRPRGARSFDLVSCLGATWVFGGFAGTLEGLRRLARPQATYLVGECYWRSPPPPGYLRAMGFARATFTTLVGTVGAARDAGFDLLFASVSARKDWDHYEGLQWKAADEFARRHPNDPDIPELRARVAHEQRAYLRWGRECLGWVALLLRAEP